MGRYFFKPLRMPWRQHHDGRRKFLLYGLEGLAAAAFFTFRSAAADDYR